MKIKKFFKELKKYIDGEEISITIQIVCLAFMAIIGKVLGVFQTWTLPNLIIASLPIYWFGVILCLFLVIKFCGDDSDDRE